MALKRNEAEAIDHATNLMCALEKLGQDFEDKSEDFNFLKQFVSSNDFITLMKAHETVKTVDTSTVEEGSPLTLSHMIAYDMEEKTDHYCQELFELLRSTQVNSLMATYDRVANKEYPIQSVQPEEIIEHEEESGSIQTVRLVKGSRQKLGATVKADNAGNILVGRILHGTIADRCGLLHSGDVIHEINGKKLQEMNIDEVGILMKGLDGPIEIKISSSQHSLLPQRRRQRVKYMKALFSYNPTEDSLLPCEEAGLQFNERNIMSVFNQDDPEWWQAKVIGQQKVGLVPSAKLRERMFYDEANTKHRQRSLNRPKNKKTSEYNPLDCEELGGKEVLTYEQVVRIQPMRLQPRPIVLMAPKCQPYNTNDIRAKLIFSNSRKYGGAVPFTSRPPRAGEVHGQHYHFSTREEMKQKILANEFIEHGEHGGHYYGLSINTVRSVINQGKTALVTVVPRALKLIHRSAELKAFVVFFTFPSDANIHQYWLDKGLAQTNDIQEIKQKTNKMISMYGQYFDAVIPFSNSDRAVIEVQRIADHLLEKPQWIPATWVA